jgi:anthranilate/para-aminobenzoate synthase component I
MSTSGQHYFETWVDIAEEPLVAATQLAASGLHSNYAVYENNGTWSYAGGILAEVTLDRRGASLRGMQRTDFSWDERPLQRVRELLTTVRMQDWRAYGWATFELSYAKNGILDHIGDETLLYLVVPRVEVRMINRQARLRTTDQETLSVLIELLTTPLEKQERSPKPINVRSSGMEEYRDAVVAAVGQIQSGQLQKVILSRVVEVEPETDLVATYMLGRRGNDHTLVPAGPRRGCGGGIQS